MTSHAQPTRPSIQRSRIRQLTSGSERASSAAPTRAAGLHIAAQFAAAARTRYVVDDRCLWICAIVCRCSRSPEERPGYCARPKERAAAGATPGLKFGPSAAGYSVRSRHRLELEHRHCTHHRPARKRQVSLLRCPGRVPRASSGQKERISPQIATHTATRAV